VIIAQLDGIIHRLEVLRNELAGAGPETRKAPPEPPQQQPGSEQPGDR
jgi:hypothetical protein